FSSLGRSPEQTGSRLHHFQLRDRFRRGGPQVPEPTYARQKSRFKGPHRLVEGVDRSRQGSPQGLEMLPENRSALVHLLSEVADLTRAFGEFLLPPPIGHGLEQSHQGHRRGNQDPALDRRFDQARIGFGGGAEEGLAGNKQDRERRRRRELFFVRLRRQFGHVPADM